MSIKNLLLWEKWRPKKIEDVVLLPRIKNHFNNGVTKNYIFHGHYGTGKTTLARILIGKYTKDKAYLEINSSLYTSIDILRSDVERFCKTQPILETEDPIKYIFLDEFERVSQQYQDALKAFIEQYHHNVRFILTTNHLDKISDGIKSRFTCIDFDYQDTSEEKFIKQEIYKKIISISKEEEINIEKDKIVSLITKKFPDIRSIIVDLQSFKETGELSKIENGSQSNKIKLDLYNILYSDNSFNDIYHFLSSNFGSDKIDIVIKLLGKEFIEWSISEKKQNIEKLFEISYLVCEHSNMLPSVSDPIIVGISLIGKIRNILK